MRRIRMRRKMRLSNRGENQGLVYGITDDTNLRAA
jgi:hypothetical protein